MIRITANKAEIVTINPLACVRLTNNLRLIVQISRDIESNCQLNNGQQTKENGLY